MQAKAKSFRYVVQRDCGLVRHGLHTILHTGVHYLLSPSQNNNEKGCAALFNGKYVLLPIPNLSLNLALTYKTVHRLRAC